MLASLPPQKKTAILKMAANILVERLRVVCAVMANPHITVTLLTWKYPEFRALFDLQAPVSVLYPQ